MMELGPTSCHCCCWGSSSLLLLPLHTHVDRLLVGILVGQGVEPAATVLALVWLGVGVDVQVLLEVSLHRKPLFAVVAPERLLVIWGVDVDDVVLEDVP